MFCENLPVYPSVLDAVRRRRGLSVRALARHAGMKHSTLVAVLTGRTRSTSEDNVRALAQALRIDPDLITATPVEQ